MFRCIIIKMIVIKPRLDFFTDHPMSERSTLTSKQHDISTEEFYKKYNDISRNTPFPSFFSKREGNLIKTCFHL